MDKVYTLAAWMHPGQLRMCRTAATGPDEARKAGWAGSAGMLDVAHRPISRAWKVGAGAGYFVEL